MSPAELETLLCHIEKQCHAVGVAVSQDGPETIAAASESLQRMAVEISRAMVQRPTQAAQALGYQARLKRVSMELMLQREQLIRRSVMNERALNAIVPATQESNYAQLAGPYGGTGRQSGAFKTLLA